MVYLYKARHDSVGVVTFFGDYVRMEKFATILIRLTMEWNHLPNDAR